MIYPLGTQDKTPAALCTLPMTEGQPSWLRTHPLPVGIKRVGDSAVVGGLVGALGGVALAAIRRHPKALYARRVGANFAILSATYVGAREVFNWLDPTTTTSNAVAAGMVTGGLLGAAYGVCGFACLASARVCACVCVCVSPRRHPVPACALRSPPLVSAPCVLGGCCVHLGWWR